MQFLRILVIAAILNVPCAFAMQGTNSSAIAKVAVATVGTLITIEGACSIQFGTSPFLPLPKMSNYQFVDRAGKAVVGLVQTGIGLTMLAYTLQ
jgi:hypothetical protein